MPIPFLTLLAGALYAGLQHKGSDPLESVVSGVLGNMIHGDIQEIRHRIDGWAQGLHPDQNNEIERAVTRSAFHADFFCLTEALGEAVELPSGRLERWSQIVSERLPDWWKDLRTPQDGMFSDAARTQLRQARKDTIQRLKDVESNLNPGRIEPPKLIGRVDENYADELVNQVLSEFEKSYGRFPDKAREVFLHKWFKYLCNSFHFEIKYNQPMANIFLAIRLEEGFRGVREDLARIEQKIEAGHAASAYELPALGLIVGRDAELEALTRMWLEERKRPLLIWGSPGIGKSTLALGLMHHPRSEQRFGRRRYQIRCDGLPSVNELKASMGSQWFGLEPSPMIGGQVIYRLGEGPSAVVIDNFETVHRTDPVDSEEWLKTLLGVEGLSLIVGIQGHERPAGITWSAPVEPGRLSVDAAKELFCSITGNEEHRNDPCLEGLLADQDGIPRAIELLAYQAVGASDLRSLAARWDEKGVELLQRMGGKGRETNLSASYEFAISSPFVSDAARIFLRVLACLPAGIHDDDLSPLAAKFKAISVLDATEDLTCAGLAFRESRRLRLLSPMRDHVRRHHAASEEEWIPARDYYTGLTRQTESVGTVGGGVALARFSEDFSNIQWAVTRSFDAGEPAAIDAALSSVNFICSSGLGGTEWVQRAMRLALEQGDGKTQAKCLEHLGEITRMRGDFGQAHLHYEEAKASYLSLDDEEGIAICLLGLGNTAIRTGENLEAMRYYQEALPVFQKLQYRQGEAETLNGIGDVERYRGQNIEALRYFEQALGIFRQIGNRRGEARCIWFKGDIARMQRDYPKAGEHFQQSLSIYRETGEKQREAGSICSLAEIAISGNDFDKAHKLLQEAMDICRAVGDRQGEARCLNGLGTLAMQEKKGVEETQRYLQEALRIYLSLGDKFGEAYVRRSQGCTAFQDKKYAEAVENFQIASRTYREMENRILEAESIRWLGATHAKKGEHPRATELMQQALAMYTEMGDREAQADCFWYLGNFAFQQLHWPGCRENWRRALDLFPEDYTTEKALVSLCLACFEKDSKRSRALFYESARNFKRSANPKLSMYLRCLRLLFLLCRWLRGKIEDAMDRKAAESAAALAMAAKNRQEANAGLEDSAERRPEVAESGLTVSNEFCQTSTGVPVEMLPSSMAKGDHEPDA